MKFLRRLCHRKSCESYVSLAVNQDLMAFAHLYNKIADNISAGIDLPIGPETAIKSLLVCYAAYEAAISGQSVQLPLNSNGPVYRGISVELYATRPKPRNSTSKAIATPSKSTIKPQHENIRIGFIGLDTSHAVTFASILNDPSNPMHIPGSAVVAAYPGGSADMEISCSRVPDFTTTLRNQFRVEMMSSPEEVSKACDFVFVLSCDGRAHLPLVRRIASCGKPIFLDKPFATSEADARAIFQIADEYGITIFGASAFRYAESLIQLLRNIRARAEHIVSCDVRFSLQVQPTQGKYFWYGIHAAEMLMVTMGSPFQSVNVVPHEESDLIQIQHVDGRISRMIGSFTNHNFSIAIDTEKQKYQLDLSHAMHTMSSQLLWAVLDKLSKGSYPKLWSGTSVGSVSGSRPSRDFDPQPADTIEIIRLLEAAQNCEEDNKQTANSNRSSPVPSTTPRPTEFEQNAGPTPSDQPVRQKPWPRRKHIGLEEREAVLTVMNREISEGGALAYGGIENRAYCRAFSEYLGGGFSLAVNSGTNAVYVALRALDLQPGSEVIVPAISDSGGVMPVALLNCIPVPVDTAFGSLNTSVQQIRSVISDRTRAVIIAHIGGHPVDIDPILSLAHAQGIAVIEDCAQAHGATYHGKKTGTCGDIAAFSTMYGKQHCTGSQGGVVFTRSSLLFTRARQIADRGKPFGVLGNASNMIASMNFNQDEISLAIGRAQLEKLPQAIKLRREFALGVAEGLAKIDGVQMVVDPINCESSYWFLQLQLDTSKLRCNANEFASSLSSEGIGGLACGYPYYPCAQRWYRDAVVFGASGHPWSLINDQSRSELAIPNALAANRNLIRVDVHEALGPTEANELVAAVAKIVKRYHVNS